MRGASGEPQPGPPPPEPAPPFRAADRPTRAANHASWRGRHTARRSYLSRAIRRALAPSRARSAASPSRSTASPASLAGSKNPTSRPVSPCVIASAQRRRFSRHDRRSRPHRLQQTPRQHERVRQVDVDRRDLQERDELRVRDLADKVDPAEVDPVPDLAKEDLLPRPPPGQPRPVAHVVAPHDDDLRPRPAGEDFRQRAHELVVAAVRLEVAVDERHHLITAGEPERRRRAPGPAIAPAPAPPSAATSKTASGFGATRAVSIPS